MNKIIERKSKQLRLLEGKYVLLLGKKPCRICYYRYKKWKKEVSLLEQQLFFFYESFEKIE